MIQIAKAAALAAVASAALIVALRLRVAPPAIVVERAEPAAWLPQRMVRVTEHEIVYQGTAIAQIPVCSDCPCLEVDALYAQLEASQPAVPRGAFVPARLVLVELDTRADETTERQVLNTISAAGFWPVVTFAEP